jgi:hypothetical protein
MRDLSFELSKVYERGRERHTVQANRVAGPATRFAMSGVAKLNSGSLDAGRRRCPTQSA